MLALKRVVFDMFTRGTNVGPEKGRICSCYSRTHLACCRNAREHVGCSPLRAVTVTGLRHCLHDGTKRPVREEARGPLSAFFAEAEARLSYRGGGRERWARLVM
jgi:hypothetical protein